MLNLESYALKVTDVQSNPIESITGSQSSLSVKAVTFGVCLAHRLKDSGLIDCGPGPGVQH